MIKQDLFYHFRNRAADLPRLSFVSAFGTICSGVAYGTCENQKTCRDAKDAACQSGDEAAYEGCCREGRSATVRDSAQSASKSILETPRRICRGCSELRKVVHFVILLANLIEQDSNDLNRES